MNGVGRAGVISGTGGIGGLGHSSGTLTANEEKYAEGDTIRIWNWPIKIWLLSGAFLAGGIILIDTSDVSSLVVSALLIVGSAIAFCLAWVEIIRCSHITGTLTVSKYLLCIRVRYAQFNLSEISIDEKTTCAYKLQVTAPEGYVNANILSSWYVNEVSKAGALIGHFLE